MLVEKTHNGRTVYVFDGYWTREDVAANEDKIFVIGDNETRRGQGGQAVIRGMENVFGICSKATAGADNSAYWTDQNYRHQIAVIEDDIIALNEAIEVSGRPPVFAAGGYGTGLAYLNRYAPRTFAYLSKRLMEEYGFDNIAAQELYK